MTGLIRSVVALLVGLLVAAWALRQAYDFVLPMVPGLVVSVLVLGSLLGGLALLVRLRRPR